MMNRLIRRPSKIRACIILLSALVNFNVVIATLSDLKFISLYKVINYPISRVTQMMGSVLRIKLRRQREKWQGMIKALLKDKTHSFDVVHVYGYVYVTVAFP